MDIEKKTQCMFTDESLFAGKIDCIVDGVIIDYKTVSDAARFSEEVAMSFQLDLYALSEMSNGVEVNSVEYRVIQKPSIRLKKNQTYEEYVHECEEWIYSEAHKRIMTLVRPVNENRLEAARLWMERNFSDIDRSRMLGYWPQNFRSCYDFNTQCPFVPICNAECNGDSSAYLIRTEYEPKPIEDGREFGKDTQGYTSSTCYRACSRRYFYEYEMAIQKKKHVDSHALNFGKLFHRAVEILQKHSLEICLYELEKLLDSDDHYLSDQDIAMITAMIKISNERWIRK